MEPKEAEIQSAGDPEAIKLMGDLERDTASNRCVVIGHGENKAVVFPVAVKDAEGQDAYFVVTPKGIKKVLVPAEDERRAKLLAADIQQAGRLDRTRMHPGGRAGFYSSIEGGTIIIHSMGESFRVDNITEADAPLLAGAYQKSQERVLQKGSPVSANAAAISVLRQAMGPK